MIKKKWSESDILSFLYFLDSILKLTDEFEVMYRGEIKAAGEELGMKYVTIHQRIGREEGKQEGVEKTVLLLLEKKFHYLPDKYKEVIHKANPEILNTWAIRLLDAKTLEDVFKEDLKGFEIE